MSDLPMQNERPHLESLTVTRFIAAAAIVVFHFGGAAAPFRGDVAQALISKAYVGVSYFFILSGFVMVIAYGRRGRVEFAPYVRNRVARIYPALLLAILMLLAVRLFAGRSIDWVGVGLNVLIVQAWFPDYAQSFNIPGWTLCTEFLFYGAFPWLMNSIYRRWSLSRIVWIAAGLWILSQVLFLGLLRSPFYAGLHSTAHNAIFYFPPMHVNQFVLGNVLGLFYLRKSGAERSTGPLIVLGLFGAAAALPPLVTSMNWHNGLLGIVFVPLIWTTASAGGWLARVLSIRPLVFLGEISYGIYILQLPVHEGCKAMFDRAGLQDPTVRFYAFFAVLLAVSAASFRFVETPLRQKMRSRASLT